MRVTYLHLIEKMLTVGQKQRLKKRMRSNYKTKYLQTIRELQGSQKKTKQKDEQTKP